MKLLHLVGLRQSVRSLVGLLTLAFLIAVIVPYQFHWIRQRREFFSRDGVRAIDRRAPYHTRAPTPPWLLGEDGVDYVSVPSVEGLSTEARRPFPEAEVNLGGVYVPTEQQRAYIVRPLFGAKAAEDSP